MFEREKLLKADPVLPRVAEAEEVLWINPKLQPVREGLKDAVLGMGDIKEAEARLARFAPFIQTCFPETAPRGGLIESPLHPIPAMQELLQERFEVNIPGKLLLKQDSHLAIAGSVKARGGIYEVLKHTEELAMEAGLLKETDDYSKLATPEMRDFFSKYIVQVGSTGNLGLSIGIASAAVGYKVIVHMSVDAKQWKKDLLRAHGVQVIEYEADYGEAVTQGRAQSDADPMSYFVDDENSKNLFLGYAVAALRLQGQLAAQGIAVDDEHPLLVTIPCGVGGAPGGVTFGLKQVYGDNVHVFFSEPTQCPCMLAGMATGLHNKVCVQDIGLTGMTEADGLACARPSGFVGKVIESLLSGEVTIEDRKLYVFMRALLESENIFLEPSACAAFQGPVEWLRQPGGEAYCEKCGLTAEKLANSTHIVWATGGALVPADIRAAYEKMYLI